jgi:hypothetical protein
MNCRISAKECTREWEELRGRKRPRAIDRKQEAARSTPDATDPYDCSDVKIFPINEIVDRVASEAVREWRDLDGRRVAAGFGTLSPASSGVAGTPSSPIDFSKQPSAQQKMAPPAWYENHVRLPERFDYATSLQEAPEDDGTGDRVVSLQDPSQTTSYERELWKLFAQIPTKEDLEAEIIDGAKLERSFAMQNEITTGITQYTRLDCHALSRVRLSDRHGLPPTPAEAARTTTLVFECWRQALKRGSSADPNRTMLEFLGSQTLLDFHKALTELTEDELWESGTASGLHNEAASGMFFIEGVFYTFGNVDYTSTIQKWMDTAPSTFRQKLSIHLGLRLIDNLPTAKMTDMRLDELTLRLGFRYAHIHHGDVETAVFLVDRKLTTLHRIDYPILHDLWTSSFTIPDCEACQSRLATVVTSVTCSAADFAVRVICRSCSDQLQIRDLESSNINSYTKWRQQGDFSGGATGK